MARITLRQLLDHAAEFGYGVPAFNINNMEQGLAVCEAAYRALAKAAHPDSTSNQQGDARMAALSAAIAKTNRSSFFLRPVIRTLLCAYRRPVPEVLAQNT